MDAATANKPTCTSYGEHLGTIARLYGGGSGAPALKMLNAFAKRYCAGSIMGEDFITHVAKAVLWPDNPCARCRLAAMAVQMTSPKIKDGITKLLPPTILTTLYRKDKSLLDLEKMFAEVENLMESLVRRKKISESDFIDTYGVFRIRAFAHVARVSDKTFDPAEWKSLHDIRLSMITEVSKRASVGLNKLGVPAEWLTTGEKAESAPESAVAGSAAKTLDDLTDPEEIMHSKGFKVGETWVKEKSVSAKMCKIISIGANIVVKPWALFPENQNKSYQMPIETFLENWTEVKQHKPRVLVDAAWRNHVVGESNVMKIDRAKCKLLAALYDAYASQNLPVAKLALTSRPEGVHAVEDIAKGELVFVPLVGLKNIEAIKWNTKPPAKTVSTQYPVVLQDTTMLKLILTKPAGFALDPQPTGFVSLYWAIATSPEQGKCNIKEVTIEVDGIVIPALLTAKAVSKFEELVRFEAAKEKPAEMRGATVIVEPVRHRHNRKRGASEEADAEGSSSKQARED